MDDTMNVKTNYAKSGTTIFLRDGKDMQVTPSLPLGTYCVEVEQLSGELYLKEVENLTETGVVYGNVMSRVDRILRTFEDRDKSTGVLLSGEKGCGKTLLAKLLSQALMQSGVSTIIVNKPLRGDAFFNFMAKIEEPCMVLFDEFEKTYGKDEHQEKMLTLFDGVVKTKKLFVVTCNNPYKLNENLINRPGRLFFRYDYNGLETDFIEEYCVANLDNQKLLRETVAKLSMFDEVSFDMLKCVVEDMNRFKTNVIETLSHLNVKQTNDEYQTFAASLVVNGVEHFMSSHPRGTMTVTPKESDIGVTFFTEAKSYEQGEQMYLSHSNNHKRETVYFDDDRIVSAENGTIVYEDSVPGSNVFARLTLKKMKKRRVHWGAY